MIVFIVWVCFMLSLLGLHLHLSQKLNTKMQEENKKLTQHQSKISHESNLIDLKKKDHEEDFQNKIFIIEEKNIYLNKFHKEVLAIVDNNKLSKQELVNQNDFLTKKITKLKTDLHNARQRSKRLAKITINTV
jgi:hypothetical protein